MEYEEMKTVSFTDFRKKASTYFSNVEQGETLIIVRHGKPIAEISPVEGTEPGIPAWKRPGIKLVLKGASLSHAIMEERKSYNQK